ncbi:FkbM family methyltransferase [Prochlorococcus marinus]|uniref:FkbM family methyltransferase n=1 Tax=Prochlorococcus marinus TaxID=1219 RepID=UPI0022B4C6D7|nr:FkbM family methyltransferase [Prochlorococcus marinus]
MEKDININKLLSSINELVDQLGLTLIEKQKLEILLKTYDDINFLKTLDKKNIYNITQLMESSRSQARQDLFVLSQLDLKQNGYFVELGAADGLIGSNSYLLEKQFGWQGILVEAAKYWHTRLTNNRRVNIEKKCVWSSSNKELMFRETETLKQLSTIEICKDLNKTTSLRENGELYKVDTISLLDLLRKYKAPNIIEYLSMDTEGSEYEIIRDFDFEKYKFRVITIERNNNREKIFTLLKSKGYKRILTEISKPDDWYIFADFQD